MVNVVGGHVMGVNEGKEVEVLWLVMACSDIGARVDFPWAAGTPEGRTDEAVFLSGCSIRGAGAEGCCCDVDLERGFLAVLEVGRFSPLSLENKGR